MKYQVGDYVRLTGGSWREHLHVRKIIKVEDSNPIGVWFEGESMDSASWKIFVNEKADYSIEVVPYCKTPLFKILRGE